MRKALLALAALAIFAWVTPAAAQRTGVTITTFANLPATCDPEGQAFVVTDANATCTAGSGSVRWCFCDSAGTGYDPQPGGTPDPDSVGTSELNDGADTPSTSQLVAVDSAASTQFEYLGLGSGLTNDGDNLDFDYSQTLAGDPALGAEETIFTTDGTGGGLLFEGSAADTNEGILVWNPTGDRTLTLPDATDTIVGRDTTDTLTNKTLTTPTIGDLTNATHDHSNAAGGGDVALAGTSTGTTASKGDSDTSIATTAFVDGEIRGWWDWKPFDIMQDGTKCKPAAGRTINSGPVVGVFECDDDAASAFYFDSRLEEYEGGTIIFTLRALNENATPSGILDFDFSCQCRGDSDTLNSTWGTAANAAITFDTQYDEEQAATAAVTPNGTCAAGDTLYCRAVMDATATTTQVADVQILGVSAMEQ